VGCRSRYGRGVAQSPGLGFPYHRIVEDLRASILDGRLSPGTRLGSEWRLAETYQTSRPTVRRAVAVLKAEGLVVTKQGQGTFVRSTPSVRLRLTGANYRRHREAGLAGFNAQVIEQGQNPKQLLLEVGIVEPPAEIAARLGVDEGAEVVVRRRLLLVNDEPVARCDSFYPYALVAGTAITQPARIRGGVLALIEDPAGPIRRSVARSVDELTSRLPTQPEAGQLRLSAGIPVIRVLRTIFDTTETVLEVQESIAAADKHEFRYEVHLR